MVQVDKSGSFPSHWYAQAYSLHIQGCVFNWKATCSQNTLPSAKGQPRQPRLIVDMYGFTCCLSFLNGVFNTVTLAHCFSMYMAVF